MFKEKFEKNINFKLNDNDINVEKTIYIPNLRDKTINELIKIYKLKIKTLLKKPQI